MNELVHANMENTHHSEGTSLRDSTSEISDPAEPLYQPNDEASQSWRIVGPTQQQWIDIKNLFTQLYIGQNRKLKEVRAILSKNHGFNASEKMFKRRITEWKIHKNYKAKDKELLAKHVRACVDAGHDVRKVSFRGRPVKLDRVKRHYRTDERFTQLWEQLSESPEAVSANGISVKQESPSSLSNSWSSRSVPNSNSSPQCSKTSVGESSNLHLTGLTVNVRPSSDFYSIEVALFHTREAVQWQFTAFTPLKSKELQARFSDMIPEEVRTGQTDQVSAFWLGLYRGFDYFHTGRADESWSIFDTCCNQVQPLMHSAPLQLLSCLLVHFATSWEGMAALEQQLLGYISSMARSTFGEYHPLAKAFDMLSAANIRQYVIESMIQMVVEGYKARRKSSNSSLFALRVDQIDLLRKRKNFQHAYYLCQQLIKDSRSMRPKRYRSALATLGRLYADQNEEFAVEGVAHRLLQHETLDSGSPNSGSAVWACDQLATLCMSRGDFVRAEGYLRRAACMSHSGLPHRGPSTVAVAKRLECCLRQQSIPVGADMLQADLRYQFDAANH